MRDCLTDWPVMPKSIQVSGHRASWCVRQTVMLNRRFAGIIVK
jgi:hypothetical protein